MKTISELIGIKSVNGDVGIEIEVEGDDLPTAIGDKRWEVTTDGSLRGGYEYVFKKPLPVGEVKEALEALNLSFKLNEAQLEFSFRTSVHVHTNVSSLTHAQLCSFIYGYLLLEEPLMTFCGRARKGNRFCLRLQDAEGLALMLHELFHTPETVRKIPADHYRYAAMNIESLSKFGSLEFRGMEGNMDVSRIETWCNALIHLRDYCVQLGEPSEVFEKYAHFGPQGFAERALGKYYMAFAYPRMVAAIQQSFSITLDIPYAYSQGVKDRKVQEEINEIQKKLKRIKKEEDAPKKPINPWLVKRNGVGQIDMVPNPEWNAAPVPVMEWIEEEIEEEEDEY